MHTVAGKSIEEHRQCCNECLTLTGSHFGDFTFVEHDTSYQLHVVVHHVPCHFVATCHPVVEIYSFIAVDFKEILALSGKVAVELRGSNFYRFILSKSASGVFNHGKNHRKYFVELHFEFFEHFFLQLVDLFPHGFALFIFERFNVFFQFCNFCALGCYAFSERGSHIIDACAQLIIGQFLDFGIHRLYLVDNRHNFLEVPSRFVAEKRFYKIIESH